MLMQCLRLHRDLQSGFGYCRILLLIITFKQWLTSRYLRIVSSLSMDMTIWKKFLMNFLQWIVSILLSRTLQSKYFPSSTLIDSKIHSKDSWVWKGCLLETLLLQKHNGLWDMVLIFHLVLIQLGSLQASTGYPLNFNNPRVVDDLID